MKALAVFLTIAASGTSGDDSGIKDQVLSSDRRPILLPTQVIAAGALDQSPEDFAHTTHMAPREWVRRLGAFRMKVKESIDSPGADAVADEHVWRQAKNGDFAIRHLSKGGGSVVWLKVGNRLLVKNQGGQWRGKAVRAEQDDVEPSLVLQSGQDLFAIFAGVTLGQAKARDDHGRAVFVYSVSFRASDVPKTGKPPPGRLRGDKVEATTSHANGILSDVEPDTLSGTITVDNATGVLLAVAVKAHLFVLPMPAPPRPVVLPDGRPPLPPVTKTSVTVVFSQSVEPTSDDALALELPRYIAEIERQHPPQAPLSFWEGQEVRAKRPQKQDEGDEEE